MNGKQKLLSVFAGTAIVMLASVWGATQMGVGQGEVYAQTEPIRAVEVEQTGLSTGEFIREFEFGEYRYTILHSSPKATGGVLLLNRQAASTE